MAKNLVWARKLEHERKRRGWTHAWLAEKVGVDAKTVGRWEKGQVPHLQQQQKIFELFGKSAEDMGLLIYEDESTQPILPAYRVSSQGEAAMVFEISQADEGNPAIWGDTSSLPSQKQAGQSYPLLEDWGSAPHAALLYGRDGEHATLSRWLLEERCRMVLILGIGGVGKTTFATCVARDLKTHFEYVIWRSLQNAPPLEQFLDGCLQFMRHQQLVEFSHDLDGQIALLLSFLREHRCLLLFDNVESIFQGGQLTGRYAQEYSGYGRLFARLGETDHQSCLLLTSREKPPEVVRMAGDTAPVRVFPLTGIAQDAGQELLHDKGLDGEPALCAELVRLYGGNPLALTLAAEPIQTLFDGNIASFLHENEHKTVIFRDIADLLEPQFQRLSQVEQLALYWLAIEREPVTLSTIRADLQYFDIPRSNPHRGQTRRAHGGVPTERASLRSVERKYNVSASSLLDTLTSLHRRSLIERQSNGHFTLQPVVQEYVTDRFIACICREILTGTINLLGSHALIKAQARDYVRVSQERQILANVVESLLNEIDEQDLVIRLKELLPALRALPERKAGYAAGNILNLLILLRADLRGLDCSSLPVWQAYMRGVPLPEVNFAYADLATSVFTDTFSSILCLAVSPDGTLLAAGTTTNELRLWRLDGMVPLFTRTAHTDGLRSVVFSPDGRLLASASEDETIRLWDVASGECLRIFRGHTSWVRSIAFSPDSRLLVSASEDCYLRVWSLDTGQCIAVLDGHKMRVRAVAFSPDGRLVASGSDDHTIRLWESSTWNCRDVLAGHTNQVRALVFTSTGNMLVSASEDKTVRLWRMPTGECLCVLDGHRHRVSALALSADDATLASCSDDHTIRLWELSTGRCLKVLQDHTNRIWSLAFVPRQDTLISASEDQTLRFWSVSGGVCTHVIQGSTCLIKSIAFSPDGRTLASGTEEQFVQLWDAETGEHQRNLVGHGNRVRCVAFSPDGKLLASGSEDETIRLWNFKTGQRAKTLVGHTHLVRAVAFTPDSAMLLSCGYDQTIRLWDLPRGRCCRIMQGHVGTVWTVACSPVGGLVASGGDDHTIRLWDIKNGECLAILRGHTHRVWSLAFSPDGKLLVSAGDDATVRIWELATGKRLHILCGHTSWTRTVAWSPCGDLIASGSHDQTVRLWNARSGQFLREFTGHTHCVWTVAFHPEGHIVASAGDDGRIRYWDVATGACLKVMGEDRLYEQMNISYARGLAETQKLMLISLGAWDENDVFDSEM